MNDKKMNGFEAVPENITPEGINCESGSNTDEIFQQNAIEIKKAFMRISQEEARISWKDKTTGATGLSSFFESGGYINRQTAEDWLKKEQKENPDREYFIELENDVKRPERVTKLASLLHEEWRASRKKEDGTFEPRLKKTKDLNWAKEHGTEEVDIANTNYSNLPEDWKGENKMSAEVAIDEIRKVDESGLPRCDKFIEQVSSVIHEKWLERNRSWAPVEQNKPYAELSEAEKEKDRVIAKKAIEIFNS